MKWHIKFVLGGILAMAFAALGGYWFAANNSKLAAPSTIAKNAHEKRETKPGKILYYRNPMGLPDTSPTPKKDPMGMEYVPVFEEVPGVNEEKSSPNQIKISTEKVQKLGVRSELAQLESLNKVIHAVGRVEVDERKIYTVTPKFDGYVERLLVNATGQYVQKGQTLFDVYSPELVTAQREYTIAMNGKKMLKDAESEVQVGMVQIANSTLQRLKNWDISETQIKSLAQTGEVNRTLSFRSPVSGIVTEKKAVQGMRFMAGEPLYQVTDLSSVWIVVDVFEQDIALVKTGAKANIKINAYPNESFSGIVSYIYPSLNPATRTVQVRLELPNRGMLLKPSMFAQIELPAASSEKVVTVPVSAVIDSGVRQIVLIRLDEGRFEPRDVTVGKRSDDRVQIVQGVKVGESVVVAANFLIDAESNLKSAVGGFGHSAHGASTKKASSNDQIVTTPGVASHRAEGVIDSISADRKSVMINHGPIESLKWPAMTMEFALSNESIVKGFSAGDGVTAEIVERGKGNFVVVNLQKNLNATKKLDINVPQQHSTH